MTLASLRERWPVWLAAVGVLLLAAPLVYLLREPAPATAPASEGRLQQVTRGSSLDLYPAVSPDGASVVYSSARDAGFELFVSGPGGERALTNDGQHNVQPAWSPDGTTIVYHSRGRGGLWLVPAAGGEPRRLTTHGSRASWSPDGTRIAFQSESQIDASWTAVVPLAPSVVQVVDARGGEPRAVTVTGTPAGGHGNPAWTPKGDRIVFVAYDRVRATLWLVNPDGTGLEALNVPEDQPMVSDPASCPSCDAIYYVSFSEQGSSGIWKLRPGLEKGPEWVRAQVVGQGLERFRHLSLSRDGRRLAYSAVSAIAELASVPVDPVSGAALGPPRLITSGPGRSSRPVFSPDGSSIAFTHVEPGARSDIWIAAADGSRPYALTTDSATDSFPSWYPDGKRVAFLSDRGGRSALWSADVVTRQATLVRDLGEPFDAPRLSPDGASVAFNWAPGGKGLNVWVMPLQEGKPRQLTRDDELLTFPAWSPDGTALAMQRKTGGDAHIVVLPLAPGTPPRRGGEPQDVTTDHGMNWPHTWAPDGDRIAFAALRGGGTWNVRWVSRSTGEQRDLTTYRSPSTYVRYPAWSPKGDAVVFEYAETRGDVWTVRDP